MIQAKFLPVLEATQETLAVEKVAQAAVRYDAEVFTGRNHALIMGALYDRFETLPANEEGRLEDGFVTNTGRFITRQEAMALAVSSGQLNARSKAVRGCIDGLESEVLDAAAA